MSEGQFETLVTLLTDIRDGINALRTGAALQPVVPHQSKRNAKPTKREERQHLINKLDAMLGGGFKQFVKA